MQKKGDIMQEVDIRVLFNVLMRRLKWIVTATIIAAVALGTYTYFLVADTYRSSFSMYVMNVTTIQEGQAISSSGLVVSQALVQEYIALLNTDLVIDDVAANLREQGYVMSSNAIRKTLTMKQVEETALLEISSTTTNPRLSKAVCDALADVAPVKIKEVMEMGTIKETSKAATGVKVGPNVVRNTILGGFLGFVLRYGLLLLVYLTDNTISVERELKRRMNVPVLGSVPSVQVDRKAGK